MANSNLNPTKTPQNSPFDTVNHNKLPTQLRFINTFMRRRTHMSKKAEMGLSDAFKHFFAQDSSNNLRQLFVDTPNGSNAPLTLEIGFGMGSSLIEMAQNAPDTNFVGIEVHQPGLGNAAFLAHDAGLTNLRLIEGDAIKVLQQLPDEHLDRVQLYFPDPWQKKRHFKRRFVSPERMQIVVSKLKTSGWFHAATDWENYAFWMLDVLDSFNGLTNLAGAGKFYPRPDFRPYTKFEKRGIDAGHSVWDLIFVKD